MSDKIGTSGFSRRQVLIAGAGGVVAASAGMFPRPSFAQDFAGQELNVMIVQPHAVAGEMMAKAFEEATGAKVNVTAVPYDQVQAQATLDVQSGANKFDVLDYWYISVGAMADEGIIEDVTDLIKRDAAEIQPDDFIPSIYDTYTNHAGRRWGLPYDGDTHVLFYNKEIFDRHGLGAPKTWEDYAKTAELITNAESANGIYGAAMLGFKVPVIIGSTFVNRLAGFGGSLLDGNGNPNLLSESAMGAAAAMADVAPHCLPTPLETAFDQALPAFLGGKVAMMEFWTDLGVYAQDAGQSKIVDKWEVVQMPTGYPGQTPLAALNAGFCFSISKGSKKKELAWEFMKWVTSPQYSLELLTTTGSGIDPTRLSGLNSDAYKAFAPKVQKAAKASLSGALAWPTNPESPRMMEALSDQLAAMLAGEKSSEDAMKQTQAAWERLLG